MTRRERRERGGNFFISSDAVDKCKRTRNACWGRRGGEEKPNFSYYAS